MSTAARVMVKQSRNGEGLFAAKAFTGGEDIFEIIGKRIACNEEDELDEKIRDNAIRLDKEWYLSPEGEWGDYLNHSCDPSGAIVKKKGRLFVVAVKPVAAGEEVTVDYSTIIGPDDSWDMDCNCGTAVCRGVITQFKALPVALRTKYKALGMVPSYIT